MNPNSFKDHIKRSKTNVRMRPHRIQGITDAACKPLPTDEERANTDHDSLRARNTTTSHTIDRHLTDIQAYTKQIDATDMTRITHPAKTCFKTRPCACAHVYVRACVSSGICE